MPRFDNEGFDREKNARNDRRDRSVPDDENYYAHSMPDDFSDSFGLDKYSDSPVIDRQSENDSTDLYSYADSYGDIQPPRRSERQQNGGYSNSGYSSNRDIIGDFEQNRFSTGNRPQRSRSHSDRPISSRQPEKSKKIQAKKGGKHRLNKPKRIVLSVIAVILVIILLINAAMNAILGKITYDERIDNKYVSSSELKSSPFVKNIMLLGVDARSDDKAESSRADSMMLVSVDLKHNTIKMTSFLRDTWVYIPAHDGKQRLNAACTYGGYSGVCDTIEYNFGIKIDGYVVADFSMFKVLVDSIGGVEVDVSEKEAKEINNHKKRYGNVKIESGKHTLTGEQALAYCRIRKIDTDFVRTKRQRTVMQSIIKGVKSSGPITLLKMASSAAPYIETNLSKSQIKRYAFCALFCLSNDMADNRVPYEDTWQYETINGASVITINKDKNKEKLIDFIYNKSSDEIKAESDSSNK